MNILWLKTDLLHPLDMDGRRRTYHLLRELNHEHPITYLTFDHGQLEAPAVARAAEYCTALIRVPLESPAKGSFAAYRDRARNVRSSLPYAVWQYRSAAMQQKIEQVVRDDGIHVVVSDFLAPTVNLPTALPVPTILFQHKVEALIWHQRTILASDLLRKHYFQRQWYRMYAYERNQCRRVDHVVAVSPEDLAWSTVEYGAGHASEISAGVDTDYFRPSAVARVESGHLVFMGAMDRSPNDDAACYLAHEIMPRLRDTLPQVRLSIVGRDPPPRVQALARGDSRIHVTGTVADVRPYLERAAIVVLPLRLGGGTRLELLESMAMEKPIVSTTAGVDGSAMRDGEHLLIADTPEEFASAVRRLLDDPAFARELGRRAGTLARSEYDWARVAADFAETCGQVISGAPTVLTR